MSHDNSSEKISFAKSATFSSHTLRTRIYREKRIGTLKFKSVTTGQSGDAFRMWPDYYGLHFITRFTELLELTDQEMCLGMNAKNKFKRYSITYLS